METLIQLGDINVRVVRKDIKNVHLSVHPPTGRVTVSAPERMSLDTVRVFAIAKLSWVRRQRKEFEGQARETPREFLNRESHYVWGRRYLLKNVEAEQPLSVELGHNRLILKVRPGTAIEKRQELIENWYRGLVKSTAPAIIKKWEELMDVQVLGLFVQRMKTKWGSCNHVAGTIRLNTDLAKKPKDCLEYVIVHEMAHLLEPTHGPKFIAYMDRFMPRWQSYRQRLKLLPVRHEHWQ